ncbi:Armadillo-type fold [Trinorchestia longiramus]|nr:Armadillo-type fold [Trinorchestia longiramus]
MVYPATVVEWSAACVRYQVSASGRKTAGSKPGHEFELFLVSCRELALIAYFSAVKEQGECSPDLLRLVKKVTFHQRYKVREAALKALGCIGTWGGSCNIVEISQCFAQHADDIPHIRMAIIKAVSKISCHMPDRYSYWHYILPCLLLWLRDADPSTREAGVKHLSAVGAQYLSENEETLHQQLQADHPPDVYPPKAGTRLNLGCRLLAQHIMYKVLPGIGGDLRDWQSSSRVASMKLLSALVVLGEHKLQQYAVAIIRLLDMALRDSENSVVLEACVCAENLGYFLLPEVSIPVVLEIVRSSSEAQCPRSVKLLELLCVGCPAAGLIPYLASAVDVVTSLASLSCDAVVQDDVLAFIQMLVDKDCLVPHLERISFSVNENHLKKSEGPAGSESGQGDVSASIEIDDLDLAEMNTRVNESLVVTESCHKNLRECNSTDCTESNEELHQPETQKSSIHRDCNEDVTPSYQLLKSLLLVIGSNICEVNVSSAQKLLCTLARTSTLHSRSERFDDRTNRVVMDSNPGEISMNISSHVSDCTVSTSKSNENCKLDKADGLNPTLAERSSSCVDHFFDLHTSRFLHEFLETCELWTPDDPQFLTASAFLRLAGQSIDVRDAGKLVRLYSLVFKAKVDSLVLVRLLSALHRILHTPHESLRPRHQLCTLIAQLLNGFMYELLSKGCRTREQQLLRSGAVEVLASALTTASEADHVNDDPASFLAGLSLVLEVTPQMLHDDLVDTRLQALRLTRSCALHYDAAVVASAALPALAAGVLERLDDKVRDIRILAAGTLCSLVTCVEQFRSQNTSPSCASHSNASEIKINVSIQAGGHTQKTEAQPGVEGVVTQSQTSPAGNCEKTDEERKISESTSTSENPAVHLDEFEKQLRGSLNRLVIFLDDPDEAMALAVAECCKKLRSYDGLTEALQDLRGRQHITAHCAAILHDFHHHLGSEL